MQPLTLPQIRQIETIMKCRSVPAMTPAEWETVRQALRMALQTNEALRAAWAKDGDRYLSHAERVNIGRKLIDDRSQG